MARFVVTIYGYRNRSSAHANTDRDAGPSPPCKHVGQIRIPLRPVWIDPGVLGGNAPHPMPTELQRTCERRVSWIYYL
eukprot:1194264-Prorocentrum_minimum.AAC.6